MVKIAFFVEGQTERIFLEKLLDCYYTHPNFSVESQEYRGGKSKIITHSLYDTNEVQYYFLIFDVGGDGKVGGAIFERAEKLLNVDNFSHVFGIRDLYDKRKDELPNIIKSFNEIFQDEEILQQISMIVAIMEIEAWFLADYNFFSRIHNKLTVEFINTLLQINIKSDNIEDYRHPSKMIDDESGQRDPEHDDGEEDRDPAVPFTHICFL